MSDLPIAIDLSPAKCRPPTHVDLHSVNLCSDDPIQAMAKSDIVAGFDFEIAHFETHVSVKRRQPLCQTCPQKISSVRYEGIHNIEHYDIGLVVRDHRFHVFFP